MSRFCFWMLAAFAALTAIAAEPALAQSPAWPARPVKFIVPFPPGGSVDALARLLAVKMNEATGQPFVVDNKPGASGSIGTALAAKSPADGYTFVFAFDTHATNPALIHNLPYDTFRDLAPVMLVGTAPMAVVTNVASKYQSFNDVVQASKTKPDSVSYGSTGNGTLGHLIMMLLQQAGGIKLVHAPYKGAGPMLQDMLGGQIDLAVATVAILTPYIKSGRVRALAVTGDKRSGALPEVPALAEQGFPGLTGLAFWAIFAPAGTPAPVLDKFHAELVKILGQPDTYKLLSEQLGMSLAVSSPEALQKFVLGEAERWGKVVRENNIRSD
jgi:tripartite-type tricarboxylate transporter receptor subunit TctC